MPEAQWEISYTHDLEVGQSAGAEMVNTQLFEKM